MSKIKLPKARTRGLVVERFEVGGVDEVVIVDITHKRSHTLGAVTALVWRLSDGRRTVEELAALVSTELGTTVGEPVVQAALATLSKAKLVEQTFRAPSAATLKRQRGFGRMVATGAVALSTFLYVPAAVASDRVETSHTQAENAKFAKASSSAYLGLPVKPTTFNMS